ncbi:hypothetical protein Si119_01937 [Streptococcus infantarius subsp. infantarius]|nr:hypothetical protein [Streptococcus infantarius subsp. infantarius]
MKPKRYPYTGNKKRLPKVVNANKALEVVIDTIDSCALARMNHKLLESRK